MVLGHQGYLANTPFGFSAGTSSAEVSVAGTTVRRGSRGQRAIRRMFRFAPKFISNNVVWQFAPAFAFVGSSPVQAPTNLVSIDTLLCCNFFRKVHTFAQGILFVFKLVFKASSSCYRCWSQPFWAPFHEEYALSAYECRYQSDTNNAFCDLRQSERIVHYEAAIRGDRRITAFERGLKRDSSSSELVPVLQWG